MAIGTMLKANVLRDKRAVKTPAAQPIGEPPTGFLFIRCEGKYYNIPLATIRYVEARSNYCRVVTAERNYMVLARLKDFAEALPSPAFCQIHRAFVVGLSYVQYFDHGFVYLRDEKLAIGEHYFSVLLATAPIFNRRMTRRKS
jgi:DNA-binding LytR/AlgR family response regulator